MRFTCVFILIFSALYSDAQTLETPQKIGHADWEYIFGQLPEYKRIENELKMFETQLQNQLKIKGQELERKYQAYRALPADAPEAIKTDRETELAYLQENIQKFQQQAQISMQKKQTDLVNPIFARVGKAIEEVALENRFSYIINPQMIGGGDVLLFTDDKYNISDLVLKKLGIGVTDKVKAPANKD